MRNLNKMKYPLMITLLILGVNCRGQQSEELTELKSIIASESYPNIDGVLISQNDSLIFEEYFNGFERDSLHDTRSSFKSVTSLLAGIAIDKGLFTVNDEIGKFILEWKNDPRGKITVKDLLEMKSGLNCECFFEIGPCCEEEMWETDNWLAYILEIPLKHEPGLNWAYTSIEPELIGEIIHRTSNMPLIDFAEKYLFGALGITEYKWQFSPEGRGYAAGSFNIKPLDMLKITQLVLDKGNYEGLQVVSEKWINESTNCMTDVDMSFVRYARTQNAKYASAQYGFMWYRELLQYGSVKTEVLFASGNGGQYMMVLEDYDAAIVFTGSNYGNWRGKLPFDILLKYLIPILED